MIEKTTDTRKAPKGATSKKGSKLSPAEPPYPGNPSKPAQDGSMDDYEAKDAHSTLMRAEEIKGNSDLMKRVMKHHSLKKKQISSLDDLKNVINQRAKMNDGSGDT